MVKFTRGLAIVGMTFVVAFPVGVAAAAEPCTYPATCVPVEITTQGRPASSTPDSVIGDIPAVVTSVSTGATLPVTGGDVVGLTLMGAAAIAVGSAMSRRRRSKA